MPNSTDLVKVDVKGFFRPDRTAVLTGVAAKWVAWIVDMQDFLNDPRNVGQIHFNCNGKDEGFKPQFDLTPKV